MSLDISTLLVINAANVLITATALPFIMGRSLSPAATNARASLIMQAVAWIAILLAGLWVGQWPDQVLSTISIACTSISQWLMFRALQGWLGPRRGERLLTALVILAPVGYAATFHSYALRVGWSNGLLAIQLLIVGAAALRPRSELGGSWRWVILACTWAMAGFTASRGILGALFTELYPTFRTPHPVNVWAMVAANMTLVLGNVAVLVAWREEAEAQLREHAFTDSLTGLLNRHGWDERAPSLFDQARRHKTPLALILVDLDHFKRINDNLGHDTGDQVLRIMGRVLRANRRSGDLAVRMGGEEFALLLPQTSLRAALHVEQRLRLALQEEGIQQPRLRSNYSAGLALATQDDKDLDALVARADTALYQAKAQGRGRMLQAI
jgi:diguanylate cyclase (GGDEF)-like protein